MPELTLEIGGRAFTVACQPGEELHLQTAASVLDGEAQVVNGSVGRVPESRMLLMAGLMLADKMAAVADQERFAEERIEGLEARLRESEEKLSRMRHELADAKAAPPPPPAPEPTPEPAPVAEALDTDRLARIAADLEALADHLESAVNA